MTSETAPATTADIVRSPERTRVDFLRLRRKIGALSLAATTFAATALPLVETARVEFSRYGNMQGSEGVPFVIQPEICEGEIDINHGLDSEGIVQVNQAYEDKYANEKSSARLNPDKAVTPPEIPWVDKLKADMQYAADWMELKAQQTYGALEMFSYVVLNEQLRYRSELTGMEIVVSGPKELDVDLASTEAIMEMVLNPDNYEHSQLSQLMACAHEKLVNEQIQRGKRMHIVFGPDGTTFENNRFQPGEKRRGIALPTNLVPAPSPYKSEALIAIAPGNPDDKKLNLLFAHEWQHAALHLIDHPIRLDPNEKQAEYAVHEVVEPRLSEQNLAIRWRR